VPTTGRDHVIAGIDGEGLLHIRIFDLAGVRADTFETKDSSGALHVVSKDASGTVLLDENESSLLKAQADAITALKRQLPGWLPRREQVLGVVKSITGQTQAKKRDADRSHASGSDQPAKKPDRPPPGPSSSQPADPKKS
jgi:hypothetical protein